MRLDEARAVVGRGVAEFPLLRCYLAMCESPSVATTKWAVQLLALSRRHADAVLDGWLAGDVEAFGDADVASWGAAVVRVAALVPVPKEPVERMSLAEEYRAAVAALELAKRGVLSEEQMRSQAACAERYRRWMLDYLDGLASEEARAAELDGAE